MDFDRAGITLPAIHGKTSAKVIKRIGMSKKIKEILAHPNSKIILWIKPYHIIVPILLYFALAEIAQPTNLLSSGSASIK